MKLHPKTIATIKKAVKKADPALKPEEENFQAACALLASAHGVFNQNEIAKAFRIKRPFLSKLVYNWRKSGVWKGRRVFHSGWDDKESGGIAFWCDVMVGQGVLERA